jgi:hypothetical protein
MKKISSKLFVALSGIMALGVSVPAVAQVSANGTIKIVQPLTVDRNQHMAFGTIVKPAVDANAGSVSVSAAASSERTLTNVTAVGVGQRAAQFTLRGEGGQTVSLGVPATFSMTGGGSSLTVTTSTSYTRALLGPTTVSLDNDLGEDGEFVFYVGGSVNIDADTKSAEYTGSFTVTASYN